MSLTSCPAPVYVLELGMGIFVTVAPTLMLAEGIRRIGSGNASIVGSIGPVFTIALSATVLNKAISRVQIVGTLLVLGSVFLIS